MRHQKGSSIEESDGDEGSLATKFAFQSILCTFVFDVHAELLEHVVVADGGAGVGGARAGGRQHHHRQCQGRGERSPSAGFLQSHCGEVSTVLRGGKKGKKQLATLS